MEIEFNNVCTNEFVDFNLIIKSKMITALMGDSTKDELVSSLMGFTNIVDGEIKVFDEKITPKTKDFKKIQSFVSNVFDNPQEFLKNNTVKREIEIGLNYYGFNAVQSRILKALAYVGLDKTILNKKSWELSLFNQKLVMIAAMIAIEPKVLLFNYIEHGLNNSERKKIKNILLDLKNKYNMTIVLLSNDANFISEFVERIIIFDKHKVVLDGDASVFYDALCSKYIDIPSIVSFIIASSKKGLVLDMTNDINELIKDIYRKVSGKKTHASRKRK